MVSDVYVGEGKVKKTKESLFLLNQYDYCFHWKIPNISTIKESSIHSQDFQLAEFFWLANLI